MNQKKFIAIHTYHSDETKGQFWAGTKGLERTDTEWRDMYIFDKCQCTAVWVGSEDFFFCQWGPKPKKRSTTPLPKWEPMTTFSRRSMKSTCTLIQTTSPVRIPTEVSNTLIPDPLRPGMFCAPEGVQHLLRVYRIHVVALGLCCPDTVSTSIGEYLP